MLLPQCPWSLGVRWGVPLARSGLLVPKPGTAHGTQGFAPLGPEPGQAPGLWGAPGLEFSSWGKEQRPGPPGLTASRSLSLLAGAGAPGR